MNRAHLAIAYAMVIPALRRNLDRAPDTVTVLIVTTLSGASVLATRTPPAAITALVPAWLGLAWGVLMTAGSACALAGVFWREELTGWSLELAGRLTLGVMLGLYAVCIAAYITSFGAAIALGLIAAFGYSSLWRAIELHRRITDRRRDLQSTIDDARSRP